MYLYIRQLEMKHIRVFLSMTLSDAINHACNDGVYLALGPAGHAPHFFYLLLLGFIVQYGKRISPILYHNFQSLDFAFEDLFHNSHAM